MFEKRFMQIKIVIMILLQQIMCNASVISAVQKWKHAAGVLCCVVCVSPLVEDGASGVMGADLHVRLWALISLNTHTNTQ